MTGKIRLCPKCGTPGEVVGRRADEPIKIVECQNPECLYEWEAAGAESAIAAFRAELKVHQNFRYVFGNRQ